MRWTFSPHESRIRLQFLARHYRKKHKAKIKIREQNRNKLEKRKIQRRLRYAKNPQYFIQYSVRYERNRLKVDPIFKLIHQIRDRTRKALKIYGKRGHTICLLGCSPIQFKQHLESLFLPGMSWANRSLWHIDHKKPISSFDLSTEKGQRTAFHYTNCQPLWAVDNLRKGSKLI